MARGGWRGHIIKPISGNNILRAFICDSYRSFHNGVVLVRVVKAVIAKHKTNCGNATLDDGIEIDGGACASKLVRKDTDTVVV